MALLGKGRGTRIAATLVILAPAVLLATFSRVPVSAQREAEPVENVMAAFIYQFCNFVEWPKSAFESPTSPVRIYIAGNGDFRTTLEEIVRDRDVGGHPIEVLEAGADETYEACHVVFIADGGAQEVEVILARLSDRRALTIGEADDFTRDGGIIRFFTENNKLRFEINVDAASRAQLKISSKLLGLARIYRDRPEPRES